ncbi:MAG: diguanylate cyclase [Magnetococcales bacterium]|nr:diguanylate cyclase [Magnetococcales bacterium]
MNNYKTTSKRPLVLVADDDELILDLIESFLDQNGYESILANNGHEAVEAFQTHHPDLALLDANMPEMDGFHACEMIRTFPGSRQVPIVMVTSLSDEKSVDRAFTAGAEDFITKPIHWAVLRQRLRILFERKEAQDQIHHQATHDSLTGLPNRTLFLDRLESAISMGLRRQIKFGLMFIDLDRFKWVNDELGHAAGDQLLKEVAHRMTDCVRQSDTVARLGGDEFTVILSDLSGIGNPCDVADKILQSLQNPFNLKGKKVEISGSIGIAIFPEDGEDSETLLRNADNAMYIAKNRGRNCCWLYSETSNKQTNNKGESKL